MEFEIVGVDIHADEYEVKKALAAVLHSDEFFAAPDDPRARRMNFAVSLDESKVVGAMHAGRGRLQVPTAEEGHHFQKWLRVPEHRIRVRGRLLKFYRVGKPPPRKTQELQTVPFVDPDVERERERKITDLNADIRIAAVQIGVFPANPHVQSRAFSIEWEHECIKRDAAWLRIHYEHQVIRISFGNPVNAEDRFTLVVKFVSIHKIATGYDIGTPYIVFDLHTPVIIEKEDYNRTLTGDEQRDNSRYRHRLIAFDDAHAAVAPYAHHLRLTTINEADLHKFHFLCGVAGIPRPFHITQPRFRIEASQRRFFAAPALKRIQRWIASVAWPVAFQIEVLMHNALLNTEDLLDDLHAPIMRHYAADPRKCADLLRHFVERLSSPEHLQPPPGQQRESPFACFRHVEQAKKDKSFDTISSGMFSCRHVTFTPTRLILEGPYAIQSNRVIRRYKGNEDNFIRVDFRDEDRLQYRWDREVDGTSFLHARVGYVLKHGFELGGRKFEFLAYSSSALREHSVWFMTPFANTYPEHHPPRDVPTIDAYAIRRTLGDFSGVANQPAKYAARMAQAFTATDPSVRIRRDQWEQVPDLGKDPYLHTDGVGSISPELADEIWAQLCKDQPHLAMRTVKPSSFQIRFLGYKGMVGVDERMEGKHMKLRPSMNKFSIHDQEEAEIEIARAFDRPMACMLSRSLIMILEDRGVHRDVFFRLQNEAKEETYMSVTDVGKYRSMLINQGLGGSYHLGFVTERLAQLGLDLSQTESAESMQYGFFRRLTRYAVHHTLREIKHNCRIPVKNGWLLPGIADEGPAYEADGASDVFTLNEGEIFACIHGPDDEEPKFITGRCIIWRSPTVHPGDIQQVFAVGKPPKGVLCSFRNLKNVVVLPSKGDRSLASQLGGGDVDGDIFYIAKDPDLFPTSNYLAARYEGAKPFTLPDNQKATIGDVCDFVVNYIGSDVLGLLSTNHLVIADQSKDGTLDGRCLELARLCGLAVDYPKSGVPVDINASPKRLIRYKPDWSSAEVTKIDKERYYQSVRALGHLYRDFELPTREDLNQAEFGDSCAPFQDNVSVRVLQQVQRFVPNCVGPVEDEPAWLSELSQRYHDELRYMCATHTVTYTAGVRLMEEEVVIGTILAECSQRRWRKDRIQRLKLHSGALVRDVERTIVGTDHTVADREQLVSGLSRAWNAWCFSVRHRERSGAPSFGVIALGIIFNCIDHLEVIV